MPRGGKAGRLPGAGRKLDRPEEGRRDVFISARITAAQKERLRQVMRRHKVSTYSSAIDLLIRLSRTHAVEAARREAPAPAKRPRGQFG